jgi:hypothetical protein
MSVTQIQLSFGFAELAWGHVETFNAVGPLKLKPASACQQLSNSPAVGTPGRMNRGFLTGSG